MHVRATLVLLVFAAPAAGQAGLEARVDSVFAHLDRTDSPGCALGVYRDGRMAYARGYGMADLELRVPITPRTVFDIGSVSKQFTAASVALLAQDGRLSLDDDVRRHVPELPEYQRPITIRQMLNHTSGLRDFIGLLTLAGTDIDDVARPEEGRAAVFRQRALNFAPGDEYLYSNSGYILSALVVERAGGKPLAAFARERIFEPLGMRATRFQSDYAEIIPDRASAYSPGAAGGWRREMSDWEGAGAGLAFTSVEDLAHWDRNLRDPEVGGARLVRDLETQGVLTAGDTIDYALGLVVDEYRGLRTVGHGGSWGGYRAQLLRFPGEPYSVAVLCNRSDANPGGLARRVADVVLEGRLGPAPAAEEEDGAEDEADDVAPKRLAATELRAYAGAFHSEELAATHEVRVAGDSLELALPGGTVIPLEARGDDVFEGEWLTLRFRREAGRVTGFTLDRGRIRGLTFERVR